MNRRQIRAYQWLGDPSTIKPAQPPVADVGAHSINPNQTKEIYMAKKNSKKTTTKTAAPKAHHATSSCHACSKKMTNAELATYKRGLCDTHRAQRDAFLESEAKPASTIDTFNKKVTMGGAPTPDPKPTSPKGPKSGMPAADRSAAAKRAWITIRANKAKAAAAKGSIAA